MILPRHWARAEGRARTPEGKEIPFVVWRWSERTLEEARASASEAMERVAARIRSGEPFPARYTYGGERPAREEIVRVHEDATGAPAVAITRNAYGALVLNTARVMFLDLDLDDQPRPSASLFGALFGRKKDADAADGGALDRLRAWIGQQPGRAARVYRTRAGLRYLITHDLFDPVGAPAQEAMAALGVDEKYRALCRVQRSFRARLTPKPWRVGLAAPRQRWPWATAEDAAAMEEWLAAYTAASTGYAVCEFIEVLGSAPVHPEVAPVLALHDEMTRVGSGLPLA